MPKAKSSGIQNLVKHSLTIFYEDGLDRIFLYGIRYLSWKVQLHRFVRSLPNPIAAAIYALVKGTIRRAIWLLHRIHPHKYTDADPYKVIYVDPSVIEYTSGASRRRGWVIDGNWDKTDNRFMERTSPKAIEQRFADGLEWDETILANKHDRLELKRHISAIEQLYQHIRDEGYKSQRQLLRQSSETAWNGLNDAMHPLANEIAVDIGPNGEILWSMCGQHRLAIAKILNIDQIPVQVFRRHAEWQGIRERGRREETTLKKFCDHPDLTDVLKKK